MRNTALAVFAWMAAAACGGSTSTGEASSNVVSEGERCGGYVRKEDEKICGEGLTCCKVEDIADVPGRCMRLEGGSCPPVPSGDDGGRSDGGACTPLPCPSGAPWNPATCSCGATACNASTACASGQFCGYPVSDACSAQGSCFPMPEATCAAYSPGCSCSGTTVTLICNGLPSGYATTPIAHTGSCEGR